MATTSMDITSFVGKLLEQDDVDALREGVRVLAQAVMETEVSGQIGAAPYERSSERAAYRNGVPDASVGHPGRNDRAQDPESDRGRLLPSLLEPRRRAEKALHAVVVEAYVKGVSTRKVDDLVRAPGIDGISRSEVSRICKVLDEEVKAFLGQGRSRSTASTCGSTRRSTRSERPVGSSRSQPWSRSGLARRASARCSGLQPGRARTTSSG